MNCIPIFGAELQALILTPDQEVAETFIQCFDELGVRTLMRTFKAPAAEAFYSDKFEAVVIDLDRIEQVEFVLDLRSGLANKNAVVLAIATDCKARANLHKAQFFLERPLRIEHVRKALQAVYSLMLRDRRQYFRLAIELVVAVRRSSGEELRCKTINVSREGMAITSPSPLEFMELVRVMFQLPTPGPMLLTEGQVIWTDRVGKAGLHLTRMESGERDRIAEWLDGEFYLHVRTATRTRH